MERRIDNKIGNHPVTLYVSDMDGTLLNSSSEISLKSKQLLNEAIAQGALFTVATARTPATVASLIKGVKMNLPACVMTGSTLWNPHSGEYSDIKYIAEDEVVKAIEIYREASLPTFIYTLEDNHIHIYHSGGLNSLEREFLEARLHTPFKTAHISTRQSDKLPDNLDKVILFFAIQPTTLAEPVHTRLINELRSTVMYYHDNFGPEISLLEIFAEGSTKARAVSDLARKLNVERIVAFGDNLNDLPLFDIADISCAVGNAIEEVKSRADVVIGINDDDAVARAIWDDYHCNILSSL
ncbi:MAG: Cof-type HAD-IIB family hydrolase [Prevotella sp.]|nr:Cof-type HAD-IIB family hydrolase [Bacteroides sp.]MCM1366488.1 Cof-type HAD-IIB family hydrolase [Prevotella sp.]MCM1436827.1 Cof-type HAD-IIB family hydrolase [Prevotella sp.]